MEPVMPDAATLSPKELKAKIPVRLHLQLHSIKVLTGRPICETVTQALDEYFAAHPVEKDA